MRERERERERERARKGRCRRKKVGRSLERKSQRANGTKNRGEKENEVE